MEMSAPDDGVLQRRAEIVEALRRIVPGESVIVSETERRAYESDGLTAYHQLPMVVVLPSQVEQIAAVLRYCQKSGVKVVPRGAGTSLSGGALPLSPASPTWRLPRPSKKPAFITRRTRRARSRARSAATSRRIPAGCIASNTVLPATTFSASRWC